MKIADISFSYPKRWRLPGDQTPSRQHLPAVNGKMKEKIVFDLNFHGVSPRADDWIDRLPEEAELESLNPLRRSYLSFTLYSLKQMMAAGTISAETAQFLFSSEWERIEAVEGNEAFRGMRVAFNQQLRSLIGDDETSRGMSLLQFEFYARAGVAGLKQFERFSPWAASLIFDEAAKELTPEQKEEYRKALWLEMRLIEERTGLPGLSKDLARFELSQTAVHDSGKIACEIDLANYSPIDCHIKAEIGHWQYETFHHKFSLFLWKHSLTELVDRLNAAAYSPLISRSLARRDLPREDWTPEARLFAEGRFLIFSGKEDFPVYPAAVKIAVSDYQENWKQVYAQAEEAEARIRYRLMQAWELGEIKAEDVYRLYRQFGFFLCSHYSISSGEKEILTKIEQADLKTLGPIAALEASLLSESPINRSENALRLIKLKQLAADTPEYKKLIAFTLPAKEAVKLGAESQLTLLISFRSSSFSESYEVIEAIKTADVDNFLPVVEEALENQFPPIRARAAEILIAKHGLEPGSREYEQIFTHILFNQLRDKTSEMAILALGEKALPALEIALAGQAAMERARAAKLIIKIKGLKPNDPEARSLSAYQMVANFNEAKLINLGEAAATALKKAAGDFSLSTRSWAQALLAKIFPQ